MNRFLIKGVLLFTCFTSFTVFAEPLSVKFTSPDSEKVSFVSIEANSHKAKVPDDVIQKFEAILVEELHQSKQFEDGGEMVIQYTIDK